MADRPTSSDREQQHADNVASRRQSGLEPMPKDRQKEAESREEKESDKDREGRRAHREEDSGE